LSDEQLIKKVEYTSNRFYNNGLEAIYINDLSGAISMLEKSIAFNIKNVEALNLLGLVYFEVGRISDALKKWFISIKIKPENNLASEYIETIKSNKSKFEQYSDSIKMYNQAVKFMKQNSDDMAVIQLKKSIEKNPKFIDALNLLALAYIIRKENTNASNILKKVLNMDINNSTATTYFKYLYPEQNKMQVNNNQNQKITVNKTNTDTPAKTPAPSIRINKTINRSSSRIMEFITFVAGCICTAAVVFILIIPSIVEGNKEKVEGLEESNAQLQQSYSSMKTETSQTIQTLQEENEKMKVQIAEYVQKVDVDSKESKIKEANDLYKKGSYEDAAELLFDLELTDGLSENVVDIYNSIRPAVLKRASEKLYNKGVNLSRNKKYDEAKTALNKSVSYCLEETATKYNSIYELGKIAMTQDDNQNARTYFQQVIENHPNSNMRNYAKNYMNELS